MTNLLHICLARLQQHLPDLRVYQIVCFPFRSSPQVGLNLGPVTERGDANFIMFLEHLP